MKRQKIHKYGDTERQINRKIEKTDRQIENGRTDRQTKKCKIQTEN
jgi:hypothetical protein